MKYRFVLALLVLSPFLHAAEADKWRAHMQTLSTTLVNAFPFFYSSTEFRDKKNEGKIAKNLEQLAAHTHSLPAKAGEAWIGAEPLIQSAQADIQKDLKRAAGLLRQGQYDESQKLVHGSIQRCFACHTAHQVGPQFPATNSEVMAMATPFTLGKAVVFGALRQFGGALDLIEKAGYAQINKTNPAADDLVKLYMVVALRAQQNFPRALTFLDRLLKDSPNNPALKRWGEDIKAWQAGSPIGAAAEGGPEVRFIAHLRESLILHRQVADAKTPAKAKKDVYSKLAAAYEALAFEPLKDLAAVYAKAAK